MTKQSRRSFLKLGTAAALGCNFLPGTLFGQDAPHNRINIAAIGIGGMGQADVNALAPGNNVVALCDADWARGAETFKKHPKARQFKDYRRMLDAMEKEIDAVLVATPDHFHAVAAMAAIRRKKHVYCEKPLAHSIWEVRELMEAARKHKVVTQLGNQGHSFDSIRTFCEMIWDGAIGPVHTIYAGARAFNTALDDLPSLNDHFEIPSELDWDIWQGPAAARSYNPAFLPAKWRRWTAYGTGTVGDWTCHVVDPVFWALDLGAPSTVTAQVQDYDPVVQGATFPRGELITYEFPAKNNRKPVTLHWHSGSVRIPRPPELERDEKDIDIGAVVVGERGSIVYGSHGASQPRLIPEARDLEYKRPGKTIPRVKSHHKDFLDAIRDSKKSGSDFSYGGPLTELALLGVIAIRLAGQRLAWNGAKGRFENSTDANSYLKPHFRQGWKL